MGSPNTQRRELRSRRSIEHQRSYLHHLSTRLLCLLALTLLFPSHLLGQKFIINEVYPAPVEDEPEWLELHNLENRTRILTAGWINDRTRAVLLPKIRIPAKGFAVLCRDTAALKEYWHIPPNAVLIETSLPSLNNASDSFVLRSADSTVIDSIFYRSRWGRKGHSLERIDPNLPALEAAQWKASEAFQKATPGWQNSVLPLDFDWRILGTSVNGYTQVLTVELRNNGLQPIDTATASIFFDTNEDGIPQAEELLALASFSSVAAGDTIRWRISIDPLPRGWQPIMIALHFARDQRPTNDTLRQWIYCSYAPRSLLFNEILYEPEDNCGEFIEIWNAAADTINLYGYKLHDLSAATGKADTLILPAVALPPRQLAVIVWDTTCFLQRFPHLRHNPYLVVPAGKVALNNTGDILVLRDPNDMVHDSVAYSPSWHIDVLVSTRNRSLEKLTPSLPSALPSSWTTCGAIAGSTPLLPNSVSIPPEHRGQLHITPNPFIARTEDPRAGCLLNYELPYTQALLTVSIYDPNGLLVRQLVTNFYTAANGELFWNGTNDEGMLLPPGPYICLFTATDLRTRAVLQLRRLIVLAPP